jgi:GH35 family endo-1,4-beta-xylanase
MAFSTNFKVLGTMTTTLLLLTAVKASIAIPSTGTTSLREEAHKKNITIGSGAINPTYLEDPVFAAVLAEQFNSLHPENEMKWSFINPSPGHYISSCCNPDFVVNITNPEALRAAMTTHFEAIMHRYEGRIDRWDVVTEALKTMGGGLNANDFSRQLGSGYINEAFRIARTASPRAKLYINENQVEVLPGKRQELQDLVSGLVADGVPIDGVALQMHITEVAPVPGVITDMVRFYKALGLQVEIAEMDVHTLNETLETQIYGAVVKEALEAGITDISFWGFTDKHAYTWVPGAKPLMFDENYKPKGAFYATHSALEDFVDEC